MRSLISLSVVLVLSLAALPVGVAGQSRKSRAAKTRRANQQAAGKAQAAAPAPVLVSTAETQSDGVSRITVAEARKAFEQGRALVLDVRSVESYNAGHVKGALSMPLNDVESHATALPRDRLIITYCS
ncbi:MAG TPA: rhodanese-like domain-containing protein [Pyrinomonadaceae bacterium]|nr:rhodanese-like domain-containing protein [Pyrinomonadaceae bacterium]